MKKLTNILVLFFALFVFVPAAPAMADTSLTWETLPDMSGRYGHAGVVVGDKVYLLGGTKHGTGLVGSVEEYTVSTGTWVEKSEIPTKRDSAGAALGPDGLIYVVGGYGSTVPLLNSLEIYDPSTDTWSTGAPMPTSRADLTAVFGSNGRLYAIGGTIDLSGSYTAIVEEYDPIMNTWSTKSPLTYARYGLGGARGNDGLIYIVGGSPQRVLEVYDPTIDTWTLKSVPWYAHIHSNFISATNGKFYLVGGSGSPKVEEYDPIADIWTRLDAPFPTPRYRLAAIQATDGRLYTFGGQPDNPNTSEPIDVTQKKVERATIHDGGEPQSSTFYSVADTYVRSGQSNQNEGAGQFMRVQSSGDNRALVRFDQSALLSAVGGGTVISAKLRLTITDNSNNWGTTGRTVDVHRLISDWTEGNGTENDRGTGSGATWNCAIDSLIENLVKNCSGSTEWEMGQPNNPAVHPWIETASATQAITNNQSGIVEYDVTADVASFATGSNSNYGWIIKKTNEGQTGQVSFGTKESTNTPQLVVTYQP